LAWNAITSAQDRSRRCCHICDVVAI
jgi:hypothetical protein